MKRNTHIESNTKSIWRIDFQLAHTLRGAHILSPNHVKTQSCQAFVAVASGKQSSWWQLLETSSGTRKLANCFLSIQL